ncbi:MAG: hypothetical protein ABSG43_28815 [Solirubrobacteraceae bacterium]|jgi:NADH:ubiquinone oxidoreductase subunit 6 (subunit J)
MLTAATALVNTSALWKIVLAAFAGGAGVVIAFGLLLLGLSRASKTRNPVRRAADYALSGVTGAFCVAAVVIGVYAMAKKPATAKPKPKPTATALFLPAGTRHRAAARL